MLMERRFSLDEIEEVAREFLTASEGKTVFAFDAEMGAGKTTLISQLCRLKGADDDFGSPTFSIINEYLDSKGNPIYHFDFYRAKSVAEAIDIGAEDYFYSGNICFIEWPGIISDILPEDTVWVSLKVNDDGTRTLTMP